MGRAWLASAIAMVLGTVAFYAALPLIGYGPLVNVGWLIPVAGGGIASYLAPRNRFNVGASTAVLAILLVGVGGYVGGMLGFGDWIGVAGHAFVMIVYAIPVALASAVGALLGEWVRSKRGANA